MSKLTRRQALKAVAAAGAVTGCLPSSRAKEARGTMKKTDAVVAVTPQGFPWQTSDPFLFCVHHDDHYPRGNERQGPAASLSGRNLGQDFEGKDGWRMYHGEIVPGFPMHPHRGFETVTVVRRGLLDHSDSMGATARYGRGDVQWLTAGRGIQHAEMFPLVERERDNPLELFQIWLNLPAARQDGRARTSRCCGTTTIPKQSCATSAGRTDRDHRGRPARYGDVRAPAPPPDSWAARADSRRGDLDDQAGAATRAARCRAAPGTNRIALLLQRQRPGCRRPRHPVQPSRRAARRAAGGARRAVPRRPRLLLLQGRPIGEPVVALRPVRDEHAARRSARRSSTTSAPASAAGPGPATLRCTRARKAASRAAPTEKWNAPPDCW